MLRGDIMRGLLCKKIRKFAEKTTFNQYIFSNYFEVHGFAPGKLVHYVYKAFKSNWNKLNKGEKYLILCSRVGKRESMPDWGDDD